MSSIFSSRRGSPVRTRELLGVLIVGALLGACEPPPATGLAPESEGSDAGVGFATEELRSGSFSFADPAVGRLLTGGSMCTATLIDPIAIVTAAHCVDYRTGSISGSFTIERSASSRSTFSLTSVKSFGRSLGRDDVAVVRLSSAVPASVATPMAIDRFTGVSMGDSVVMYGYGCRSSEGDSATGRKQRFATRYSDDLISCPGDSGGPVIKTLPAGLRVVAKVFSGSRRTGVIIRRTRPLYGLVSDHAYDIRDQVDDWAGRPRGSRGGGGGGGGGGRTPPMDQF